METFSKWRMSDRTGAFVRAGTSYSQIRAAFSNLLILKLADSSRRTVSFRKDTSEMRASRDEVRAEQLTAYRQVSGCKGKHI